MKDTSENEKTWDKVADLFVEASALPVWGPFSVGDDLDLLPDITGKTFLEVGCGSGRSIKYLVGQGASKVYASDISAVQIEEAREFNNTAIAENKVELIKGRMEDKINIEPVDVVFSVYAIGWTLDPVSTFNNIYSYLKKDGLFVWSWDHKILTNIEYQDGKYVVADSYHDESLLERKNWRKDGTTVHITYRKVSTWFKYLTDAGFEIIGYHEPRPKNLDRGSEDPTKHYAIEKARKVPATFIFVCKKK
jgi:SAM-dependent methyltransferase